MKRHLPLRPRVFAAFAAIVVLGLVPVAPDAAFRAGALGRDPVIAAAGDIACDPTSASYNSRDGTATAC